MRFIFIVILFASLVIASVDPLKRLKEDLKQSALESRLAIDHSRCKLVIDLAELILINRVANETEIKSWENFYNQWANKNESYLQDETHQRECIHQEINLMPKLPDRQIMDLLIKYSRGGVTNLISKQEELQEQQIASFQTRVIEILQEAKKVDNFDYTIRQYSMFAEASPSKRLGQYFSLMDYIKNNNRII